MRVQVNADHRAPGRFTHQKLREQAVSAAHIDDQALVGDTRGNGRQRAQPPANVHVQAIRPGQRRVSSNQGMQINHEALCFHFVEAFGDEWEAVAHILLR